MNVRQALLDAGINVFAVDLLCESFLKSALAKMSFDKGEPIKVFIPIQRSDCAGWVGVDIALAAVDKFDEPALSPQPQQAAVVPDELTDEECDRICAQTMDAVAAENGMHALDLNPDITMHHTLRRALIRNASRAEVLRLSKGE